MNVTFRSVPYRDISYRDRDRDQQLRIASCNDMLNLDFALESYILQNSKKYFLFLHYYKQKKFIRLKQN